MFIFGFHLEITGAAVATMLSNLIAMLYFMVLILVKRDRFHLTMNPRYYSVSDGIPKEVLLVGLPSCIMNLMGIFSNITLSKLLVHYSNAAVAGIGIAKKIDMLAFAIANGLSQGVIPLIGYNYSAKNIRRMRSAIKVTLILSITVTTVGAVLLFTCANPLVLSMLRKGGLDVPFMFLLDSLAGANAIAWATPIADCGAMLVGLLLFVPLWRKMGTK